MQKICILNIPGFSGGQDLELGKRREIQRWRGGPGEQAELIYM